ETGPGVAAREKYLLDGGFFPSQPGRSLADVPQARSGDDAKRPHLSRPAHQKENPQQRAQRASKRRLPGPWGSGVAPQPRRRLRIDVYWANLLLPTPFGTP